MRVRVRACNCNYVYIYQTQTHKHTDTHMYTHTHTHTHTYTYVCIRIYDYIHTCITSISIGLVAPCCSDAGSCWVWGFTIYDAVCACCWSSSTFGSCACWSSSSTFGGNFDGKLELATMAALSPWVTLLVNGSKSPHSISCDRGEKFKTSSSAMPTPHYSIPQSQLTHTSHRHWKILICVARIANCQFVGSPPSRETLVRSHTFYF